VTVGKQNYRKGETVDIVVKGTNLRPVNALGFVLPYNPSDYEFAGVKPLGIGQMENLTNDRLHTNGEKVLYLTFVNIGDKSAIEGNADLFILKLKARLNVKFNLRITDGFLVDKNLSTAWFY